MNLYFRLLAVFVKALFRRKIGLLDESEITFRVWPGDLDINMHMNNGGYLALMDLGRLDLIIRMGLLKPLVKLKWRPMVGSEFIRFKKGLRPFQKFTLRTRVVAWDGKWVFITQSFGVDGREVAAGVIKGLFRSPAGNVPSSRLVEAVSPGTTPPDSGEGLTIWEEMERSGLHLPNSNNDVPA